MDFVENIVPFAMRLLSENTSIAIVTLVGIEGSSPRPPGSQLVVGADGRSAGMITGGCAEKAIAAEAMQCLEKQQNKLVRYGNGSPYLDVVLPCGSGIDLYIETLAAAKIVAAAASSLERREPISIDIYPDTLCSVIPTAGPTDADGRKFSKLYEPDFQIFAFGEGANLVAFSTIAQSAGYKVKAFSPDQGSLQYLESRDIAVVHLARNADFLALPIDRFTAVVTFFHEHEWEADILFAALNSDASYIGALGSRKTHELRLATLASLPPTRQAHDNIRGPVGLDIGASNPNEIALSVLAELTLHRRRQDS